MFSYRQAQATVLEALPKLNKFKISTKRPEDYFAEMAKSDQQMQKVRKLRSPLMFHIVIMRLTVALPVVSLYIHYILQNFPD